MTVDEVIGALSTEEKVALCSGQNFWYSKGIERLGLRKICMSDGPHGLRYQNGEKKDMIGVNQSQKATCFPPAVTSSQTWNRELLEKEGKAIGEEARHYGVDIVLGPGCNIKRNPLAGRNFEYFSEDPYVTGELAQHYIQGMEGTGIGCSIKHFALNNQEYKRMNGNSIVDEKTMREIYLAGFEKAIQKGKPSTVMCSYNKINGVHASDNQYLLKKILRDEWGFEGAVISDWGAMNDRIASLQAGMDLSMPGGSPYMEKDAVEAVKKGLLGKELDDACRHVIQLMLKKKADPMPLNADEHHALAKEIAGEGCVLLKNEDNILPVQNDDVLVVGYMGSHLRYQGTGSSHINPTRIAELNMAEKDWTYIDGCDEKGNIDEAELELIKKEVKKHAYTVVTAGLPETYESEGFDRTDMKMPQGHVRMIEACLEANENTIVVLLGGGVMELPFLHKVKALLYPGLPGQAGGEVIADILKGKINPSGKLSETWPLFYQDVPSRHTFDRKETVYSEGIYVGYRYYDKAGMKVAFPFGHGLSYASFQYSNLQVTKEYASVTITNISDVNGKEIVQLYVGQIGENLYRPLRELKGFEKIGLDPHQSREVKFYFDDKTFAVWDHGWKVPQGTYEISIGASSRDLRCQACIDIAGTELKRAELPDWYVSPTGTPSMADYEKFIGHHIAFEPKHHKGSFTMDNSCLEMKDESFVMKMMYRTTKKIIEKQFGSKDEASLKMMVTTALDCPLRASVINSAGQMKEPLARGLLDMANGHMIQGIMKMCRKDNL
jgi:beta-glucosidase